MENEGFLFINHKPEETFKKGAIYDVYGIVKCPGEIIPSLVDGEILSDMEICQHAVLPPGLRVRIYYDFIDFNISSETQIYPPNLWPWLHQINFDLLDSTKCYYAISTEQNIYLHYITDVNFPQLSIPDLSEDLAFEHHVLYLDGMPSVIETNMIFIQYTGQQVCLL